MTPDFNKEFKSFTENSKIYKELMKTIQEDGSYKVFKDEQKLDVDAMVKAVFESVIIFSQIVPNQVQSIMRGSLDSYEHAFQSLETAKFIKANSNKKSNYLEPYFKSLTLLVLSRPVVGEKLSDEIQGWTAPVKKAKP